MGIILALWPVLASVSALASDACDAQLSDALKAKIEIAYPGFRTPLKSDNLADDVEWDVKQGGSGCIAVSQADFDGNGQKDVVLALTEEKGPGGLVVVALAEGKEWQFHQLAAWAKARSRLYVGVAEPGIYWRAPSLDGPLAAGEVERLECPNALALFGASEATGVVSCYERDEWKFVWVLD